VKAPPRGTILTKRNTDPLIWEVPGKTKGEELKLQMQGPKAMTKKSLACSNANEVSRRPKKGLTACMGKVESMKIWVLKERLKSKASADQAWVDCEKWLSKKQGLNLERGVQQILF